MEDVPTKQAEMQNTVTRIKYSLEGTNSRTQEAEERISEVEDRLGEITDVEQKRERRLKRTEDGLGDSGIALSAPTSILWGCQKEKRERMADRRFEKKRA